MNKFLMIAIAAITLGMAAPAMADDHAEGHDAMAVEATTDATTEAVAEVCMNDEGVEIECPAVEVEVETDTAAEVEAHDDAEHHDAQ